MIVTELRILKMKGRLTKTLIILLGFLIVLNLVQFSRHSFQENGENHGRVYIKDYPKTSTSETTSIRSARIDMDKIIANVKQNLFGESDNVVEFTEKERTTNGDTDSEVSKHTDDQQKPDSAVSYKSLASNLIKKSLLKSDRQQIQDEVIEAKLTESSEVNKTKPEQFYEGRDFLQDPIYNFDPHFKNPCWYEKNEDRGRSLRCLPYFYVIGVKKCGTSDLFYRLSQHPDFANPGFKEAQFFARSRFREPVSENGVIEKYVQKFDYAAEKILESSKKGYDDKQYNEWTITGEASPSNLHLNTHWKNLPGNEGLDEPKYVILDYIHHFLPKAKVIITFRDPIERLYSDYYHEYGTLMPKNNPSPDQFHEVVTEGVQLYRDCFAVRSVRSCVYDHTFYNKTKIQIQLGIYYVFWQDLLRLYSREQILVLQNKELKDKEKTMSTVFEFLGLRPLSSEQMQDIVNKPEANTLEAHNNTRVPMLTETYDMLHNFYQPFNIRFSALQRDATFLYL